MDLLKQRFNNALLALLFSTAIGTGLAHSAEDFEPVRSSVSPVVAPEELVILHHRNLNSLRASGFIDKSGEVTRADYILSKMAERFAVAKSEGRENVPSYLGYYEMNNPPTDLATTLIFQPTFLSSQFIGPDSESYVIMGTTSLKQLYTNTKFGTLIIDESIDTKVFLDEPNIQISGYESTFAHYRHAEGKWASVLYVPMEERLFIVESDTYVADSALEEFSRIAIDLVEKSKERAEF